MTIDLDQLERLAKAATPGPWRVGAYPAEIVGDTHVCIDTDIGVKVLLRGNENFYKEAQANSHFCATANPTAILELVAEVRRLREDAEHWNWFKANYGAMSIHENFAADLPNIFALGLKGRSWDEIGVAIDAARKEKA